MFADLSCVLALLLTAWAGGRSLPLGLIALFSIGYAYGIARANLPSAASHFIFDASMLGLYVSQKWSWRNEGRGRADIQVWAIALMAWPLVMTFLPFQDILVTLVGLRGAILFLPLIMLGCRLRDQDLLTISKGLALLNVASLAFAVLEYFVGLEPFFPRNTDVTYLLYASHDVAGGAYRIPSFFPTAHVYGGTMVMTIPWLFGAWSQGHQTRAWRAILALGLLSAFLGVLLSATRVNFILAALLLVIATCTGKVDFPKRLAWLTILIVLTVVAARDERLQRFTTLGDSDMVTDRFEQSVNTSFWDILRSYPFGNGLGGGGTNIPYFLQDRVKPVKGLESEYTRILAEQGVIGLFLWVAFIFWHLQNRSAFQRTKWLNGRRLAWFACTGCFATGVIGMGLLTGIPATAMILLSMGWISAPPPLEFSSLPPGLGIRAKAWHGAQRQIWLPKDQW